MAELNKTAAEVLMRHTVHGCTDITGFGLLGHGLEMAAGSKVTLRLDVRSIPVLPGIADFVALGMVPGGSYANRNFCATKVRTSGAVDPVMLDILAIANLGGLFASVPPFRQGWSMNSRMPE